MFTSNFSKHIIHSLFIDSPLQPGQPFAISVQSTSITIGWTETFCNGGHTVTSFTIRHRRDSGSSYSYYYSYNYIRDIDPSRRNYTITGLQSNTYYSISVQSVDLYAVSSSFSSAVSVTTLPPGRCRWTDCTIMHPYMVHNIIMFRFFCRKGANAILCHQNINLQGIVWEFKGG